MALQLEPRTATADPTRGSIVSGPRVLAIEISIPARLNNRASAVPKLPAPMTASLLKRFPLLTVDLVPVAAPGHPLAEIDGPIETHVLHNHVQLVLTDRSALTPGRDYGVLSGRTWRLADLGAKQSMLLAGLGWGNMPAHMVETDIAQGRLKIIRPVEFDARTSQLVMCGATLADHGLGPAGQWMIEHLADSIGRNSPSAKDDSAA
jgi:DNA-binding transcriptional LysR family regulator